MANPTFEQMLAQQAANPNFLGGVITAGAAKLMSDRTLATSNSISKLNESLKIISDEPLTTAQQTEQLNNDPSVKDKLKTITEQAQDYQAMTQNVIARKEKYSQVYDQALTELAMIGGEDAQRLAKVLQSRKEDALAGLDEKAQVPERVLRYQALQTEFAWNKDKYAQWYDDKQMRKDIASASDTIIQDPEFGDIQGGDVNTWDSKKLKDFTERQNRIIDRAYDRLGGKVSKGSISRAFKVAMDNTGKSFKFQELNPLVKAQLGKLNQENKADINLYKGILTAWSGLYRSLDPNTKDVLSSYMKTGKMPDDAYSVTGDKLDEGYIKDLSDIYKPDGEYGYYYSGLTAGLGDDFYKKKQVKLKSGSVIEVPKDKSLVGIIRANGFEGFMNQSWDYNPDVATEILETQRHKFKGLQETGLKTAEDNFNEELLNSFQNTFNIDRHTDFIIRSRR